MKKVLPVILIITSVIIILFLTFRIKNNKTVDWEESFNEKSNKPYGVNILYKELPNLFKNNTIRTVYHKPASYLIANSEENNGDHIAKGSFMVIGNSDYLFDDSINELLQFVEKGNTLFISDYYFADTLSDTLNITIDFAINKKDSISQLLFKSSFLKHNNTVIDKNEGDYYFSSFDSINYNILGYSKIDEKRINFLEIPYGKGSIYLHLQPKIFTNYNLLKADRYKYVEAVLSYLPDNDVYFDSYTKIYTSYDGDVEKKSNLSWFLEQISFKWAWYTALVFGLLFIIFNAKRRQRIIKIIKPLQNTTIAFVKTISNLYFETQDHKNLIAKKITYFLEKIRSDYNLDTSILNEAFINKLTSKSGKKKESINKLINYIKWLQNKDDFFEKNLIILNKLIENFYSK